MALPQAVILSLVYLAQCRSNFFKLPTEGSELLAADECYSAGHIHEDELGHVCGIV